MQDSAGIVRLGRHAVLLRSLGDPGFPAAQKQDRRVSHVILLHQVALPLLGELVVSGDTAAAYVGARN